jgi:hypothetical protein
MNFSQDILLVSRSFREFQAVPTPLASFNMATLCPTDERFTANLRCHKRVVLQLSGFGFKSAAW